MLAEFMPLQLYDPGFLLAVGWRTPPLPKGHLQILEDADRSVLHGLCPWTLTSLSHQGAGKTALRDATYSRATSRYFCEVVFVRNQSHVHPHSGKDSPQRPGHHVPRLWVLLWPQPLRQAEDPQMRGPPGGSCTPHLDCLQLILPQFHYRRESSTSFLN